MTTQQDVLQIARIAIPIGIGIGALIGAELGRRYVGPNDELAAKVVVLVEKSPGIGFHELKTALRISQLRQQQLIATLGRLVATDVLDYDLDERAAGLAAYRYKRAIPKQA